MGNRRAVFSVVAGIVLLLLASGPALAAAQRVSVKVNIANVREKPSRKAKVVWQVARYHPFEVIRKKGDWYRCRDFEGDTGWVAKTVLCRVPTVITTKNDCNVRSGPGTRNRVLFILDREIPLKVLSRKGRWLKVEHEDGDRGWIHASLVW